MNKYLTPAFYKNLVSLFAELYPVQGEIRNVLISSEFPQGAIDLQGPAVNMWDSVLAYAESNGKLKELIAGASEKFKHNPRFTTLKAAINDGSAFLSEMDPAAFLSGPRATDAVPVAILYDPADQPAARGLVSQLKVLELSGLISLSLAGYTIDPGAEEEQARQQLIGNACIVLLCVTPSFFANSQCLQMTFNAYAMKKWVVPILVKECSWGRINFLKNVQPLPRDRSFISAAANPGRVEYEVGEEIAGLIDKMKSEDLCR